MPRAWEEDTDTNATRKQRRIKPKRKPTSRPTKRRSSAYPYPPRSPILGKACGRPPQEAARSLLTATDIGLANAPGGKYGISAGSFRLDARGLDHLAPLVGF